MQNDTSRKLNNFYDDSSYDVRLRDPNAIQQDASNPLNSIWVSASAGTGKTKVLTDRLLRLLLPKKSGEPGSEPFKILCLTFTKAAANEMSIRLFETLGQWAVMPVSDKDMTFKKGEKTLAGELQKLFGEMPTEEQIAAAQTLFSNIVDAPNGLKIMTIHSFCESILGRFPLEADLSPNFKILEDAESKALILEAQKRVLKKAVSSDAAGSPLSEALAAIARVQNEDQVLELIADICKERAKLAQLLSDFGDVDSVYERVCTYYGIPAGQAVEDYRAAFIQNMEYIDDLRGLALFMSEQGGKIEQGKSRFILDWMANTEQERIRNLDAYVQVFLTSQGGITTQGFPTKKTAETYPQAAEILSKAALHALEAKDGEKARRAAFLTRALLILGKEINDTYTALKNQVGALDFDDLILKAYALLKGRTVSFEGLDDGQARNSTQWIMYKLDQGIDHILVDEAQDTNPEQWRIIDAITSEFYAGLGAKDDIERTSFTVGDIKQSIYSFQRANPDEFKRMREVYDERIRAAGKVNKVMAMDISFRSVQPILDVVDSVFARSDLKEALGGEDVRHTSFRKGQTGVVELWPLVEAEKPDKRPYWDPPVEVRDKEGSSSLLAGQIADTIKGWLDNDIELEAYGRAIRAGDIMVLVRTRNRFVDELMRALKARAVPVSGADRLKLGTQIIVQDMLAAAKFCLLPADDLNLAAFLKSPFIGFDDSVLFTITRGGKGSLWAKLAQFDPKAVPTLLDDDSPVTVERVSAVKSYLEGLRAIAFDVSPYEFFMSLLGRPCPADLQSGFHAVKCRLGEDAIDPVEEFLALALGYSENETESLQSFIQMQDDAEIEIKRELEEAGNQVRIMTVHGSKGLQAPIVFLPDTVMNSAGRSVNRLLWPDKTDLDIPLWSPRKDDDPALYTQAYNQCEGRQTEEYYRLLYVAMTRAADRLYVCGYTGQKKPKEHSWYYLIEEALARIEGEGVETLEDGSVRYSRLRTRDPDRALKSFEFVENETPLPDWVYKPAPEEPVPPRPLIPSRDLKAEEENIALSPLKSAEEYRFLRGNLTHKLLQFLPQFPDDKRQQAAEAFLNRNGQGVSAAVQESVVAEIMKILEHPDYAPFFDSESSFAEVPVSALIDGKTIVNGQIDRLVVRDSEVWILDYKTNRPPPTCVEDVPEIYIKQMKGYFDTVRSIYPEHEIRCGLLWTDGPELMILDIDSV